MTNPDLSFQITYKIRVHVDLDRRRVVIACKMKDGKSLHLETTYKALDHIHREVQKQLDR